MEAQKVLDLASNIIQSIAWPVVVIVALVIFREPLKNLLMHATKARLGPVEVERKQNGKDGKTSNTICGFPLLFLSHQ